MPIRSWVHSFDVQTPNLLDSKPPFLSPVSEHYNLTDLSSKTLLVPIVSTANVSQLAADILIETLSLSRVGIFDCRYHIPIVGGREKGEPGVTTPIELFGNDDTDFVVIQQRSPALKSQKEAFISTLVKFIGDVGFKSVLFIAGVNAMNRTDAQMLIPLYHIPPSSSSPVLEETPIKLLASLPKYTVGDVIPGAGLTHRIINSLSETRIPFGILVWMGMEGDNREDARLVAGAITKILGVDKNIAEWKEPESWKQGLFGTPGDQTLYG